MVLLVEAAAEDILLSFLEARDLGLSRGILHDGPKPATRSRSTSSRAARKLICYLHRWAAVSDSGLPSRTEVAAAVQLELRGTSQSIEILLRHLSGGIILGLKGPF